MYLLCHDEYIVIIYIYYMNNNMLTWLYITLNYAENKPNLINCIRVRIRYIL